MRAESGESTASDKWLYQRTLQGDTTAFELLVDRYHAPLFRFLYRQTGDYMLAEDLLQETFTRLITYHGDPPAHFRAWAYTVASNLTRDHFRSAHYRHEADVIDQDDEVSRAGRFDPSQTLAVEDILSLNATSEVVAQALQQLTPEQRETVILRFYHSLPLDEIALISSVPLGTVKSRLFHALRRLKGLLLRVGMDS